MSSHAESSNDHTGSSQERVLLRVIRTVPGAYWLTAILAALSPDAFGIPWWVFGVVGVALATQSWVENPSILRWLGVIAAAQAAMGVLSAWDGTPAHPDVGMSILVVVIIGLVGVMLVKRVERRAVWAYALAVGCWTFWISLLEGVPTENATIRAAVAGAVLAIVPLVTVITRERLFAVEAAQAVRLQLQAAVADAVRIVVVDGSRGLPCALEKVADGIGADIVTVERYERRGSVYRTFELWSHGSCPTVRVDTGWDLPADHSEALCNGRPARIESPVHGAVLPITSAQGLLGGIRLACDYHHHVEPEDLEMIGSFAEIIGTTWAREDAVDQAERSRDSLQANLERQNALADAARSLLMTKGDETLHRTLATLIDSTRANVASIWTPGDQGLRVIRATMGERGDLGVEEFEAPLAGFTSVLDELRAGNAVSVEADPNGRPHEQLFASQGLAGGRFAPIIVRGTWHGALSICQTARDDRFEAEDLAFLERVGILVSAYFDEQQTRDQLRDLLRSKDRFIASVSHELRTPLAAVVGLSAELATRDHDFAPDERIELASMVSSQAAEVSYIVEDLLVAARAESDMLTIVPEPVSLCHEVREVLEVYEPNATIELDAKPARSIADSHRTRQIIRNLLVNADRYGGRRVRVETGVEGDMAYVAVCDDGPGVDPDRVDAVFDPYERAHDVAGTPDSVGLGLAVARQLARLMGGDVIYERDDWTVFRLLVPLDRDHPESGAGLTEAQDGGNPVQVSAGDRDDRRHVAAGRPV